MVPHSLDSACLDGDSQILWEDGERVVGRTWHGAVDLPVDHRRPLGGDCGQVPTNLAAPYFSSSCRAPSHTTSVSDFLKADPTDGPSCLVLDVRYGAGVDSSFSAS
jgi:hypothetical protein